MEEYKSNSHKSRQNQNDDIPEKRVEKVVSGSVKSKKKNGLQKITNVFVPEDVDDVKSYIFEDIVVPAVKDIILDAVRAYDAYFYGNNRSYEVVQRYQRAWLLHIHRNPHHWQYWILIHDDMEDGELETILEMPYDYIIEMICDWWSFSWQSGNLYEIFKWYEEHAKYIRLHSNTKVVVEHILNKIHQKLNFLQI